MQIGKASSFREEQRAEALFPYEKEPLLRRLRDPTTGQYYALEMLGGAPWKQIVKRLETDEKETGTEPELRVAVVDTGMVLDHPWIKPLILKSKDFTGEGIEDLNGHGTLVTLLLIAGMRNWVPFRLLNAKVLRSNAKGSEENIIKGIRWSVEEEADMINLSVGVYREKYGMPECKGDCELCRAAEDATRKGCIVMAAAGNAPGQTCCPAKVGLVREKTVASIGALIPETGKIAPYSGIGNTYAPEPRYRLIPLNGLSGHSSYTTEWFDKGVSLERLDKHSEALTAFEKALELSPTYALAVFNKGVVLERLGRDEEALSSYDRAMELDPSDFKATYNKGVVLHRLGKYEDALLAFENTIRLNPNHADAWSNKGVVLGKLGEKDEALLAFDKSIQLIPADTKAWTNKGICLRELGKHEQALSALERAIEIDQNNTHAWTQKGLLLCDLGRYEEASSVFDKTVKMRPNDANTWYYQGTVLERVGRNDEALLAYDKAIELCPIYASAWNNKGALLGRLGRYKQSLVALEKAIELDPTHADVWTNKGASLAMMGRSEEALQMHDKAIELDPKDVRSWTNKGDVFYKLGKYDKAHEAVDRALQIDSSNEQAIKLRQMIENKNKRANKRAPAVVQAPH